MKTKVEDLRLGWSRMRISISVDVGIVDLEGKEIDEDNNDDDDDGDDNNDDDDDDDDNGSFSEDSVHDDCDGGLGSTTTTTMTMTMTTTTTTMTTMTTMTMMTTTTMRITTTRVTQSYNIGPPNNRKDNGS
ncbi:hypothetical protein HZH66_011840 [Vespula vulgaris]|uniref:Uncharacterized protein n=1 Tax=Vespula vulgaris TaxID=7454 RepID=A0A834MWT5_VESVU|nr:hypothetical protein HZH66_011840 [Vespula vulgaris]